MTHRSLSSSRGLSFFHLHPSSHSRSCSTAPCRAPLPSPSSGSGSASVPAAVRSCSVRGRCHSGTGPSRRGRPQSNQPFRAASNCYTPPAPPPCRLRRCSSPWCHALRYLACSPLLLHLHWRAHLRLHCPLHLQLDRNCLGIHRYHSPHGPRCLSSSRCLCLCALRWPQVAKGPHLPGCRGAGQEARTPSLLFGQRQTVACRRPISSRRFASAPDPATRPCQAAAMARERHPGRAESQQSCKQAKFRARSVGRSVVS
mmetsp:Transcript_2398/g.5602  ORF Transcript_2398/g.5602 Transcript_2398/m.5602 type:complete len:257 (+) Transcript_2398:604-1374(+)